MASAVPPKGQLAPSIEAWKRPYTPGPFTPEEVEQFYVQGYVIKRGLLDVKKEIEPARASVADLVEDAAQDLFRAGKITDLCADVPFERRLVEIEKQFPNAAVLLHKRGVLPAGVADLWAGDTLMGVAKQLLGDDLMGHPVWNLRSKVPAAQDVAGQTTVPWHQDTAYLEGDKVLDVLQVTAWVPLVDATRENGCMEVIRYGHRSGKEVVHDCCVGGTWYVSIREGELAKIGADDPSDVVLCEVAQGDVLFLNNVIPHRSLANTSQGVRWSLDLRWQRPDKPVGFYGLKEGILMSKAGDPSFRPDWAAWAGVDRNQKQLEAVMAGNAAIAAAVAEAGQQDAAAAAAAGVASPDPFDTVIAGPWMGRWSIINHNRHTARFTEGGGKLHGWHAGNFG